MEEFFISGVAEIEGNCEQVNDDEAQFFTVYRRDNGPSWVVQDFLHKRDAESFLSLLESCIRTRNQLYAAGYEPKQNSLNPTECLLHQTIEAIQKAIRS